MALINCPECSTVVSEHAMACVKCGYPIQKFMEDNMKENSIYESEQNQNIYGGTGEINEPFLSAGEIIYLIIALAFSVFAFAYFPVAGIGIFLVFAGALYLNRMADPQLSKRTNPVDVNPTEGNNRVNGYIKNPYHGKIKMVWGMIIFIIGILTFFGYPHNFYVGIFIGSFGFFLIIIGKAEHWWHWG